MSFESFVSLRDSTFAVTEPKATPSTRNCKGLALGNHTFGPFGLASGSFVTFRRLRICRLFQNLRQVSRDGI